jgi:hypothetical protein
MEKVQEKGKKNLHQTHLKTILHSKQLFFLSGLLITMHDTFSGFVDGVDSLKIFGQL